MPRFTPRTKTFAMPDLVDRFPPAGNPPDGYVITYSGLDGYYYPKRTSKLLIMQLSPGASPYNVGEEDAVLVPSHVGAYTVNLPVSPIVGTQLYVKDAAGVAAGNPITLVAQALSNIDAVNTYTINVNWGSVRIVWNGTNWLILSNF